MTKAELLETLKVAAGNRDIENAHLVADQALLDFINDSEISMAYDAIPKWYA